MLLNDTDPLYKRLKHMHIAELSTQLHAEYKVQGPCEVRLLSVRLLCRTL